MSVRVVPAAEPPSGALVGEWPLRAVASSAPLARRLVTQAMEGAPDPLLRRAALVVSELVSTSIRHAPGIVSVALHRLAADWVVAVTDSSTVPPQLRDAGPLSDHGRGLLIVHRVSRELGWARTPTGKVVWARLSPRGPDDDT